MSEFDPPIQQDALASVGQRALAQIIDGLVLLPVLFLVVYLMSGEIPIPTEEDQVSSVDVWATFALVVIQVAYNTVCVAMWGATVGKRALRLRVVRQDDGGAVSYNYAALRALIPAAASLIPVIGIAAPIVIYMRALFHPLRKGWHDQAAGTIVVRR
jgi:uncharacterized RDD family membrane protein YckC